MAKADGAGGGDEENPFSFKSFIKRASTSGPGADSEGKGGKKDRERPKGKKSSSTLSQDNEAALPFPEEGEENPFSFKKFVRKQTLTKLSEGSSGSEGDNSLSNSVETPSDPLSLEAPSLPHSSGEGGKDKPVKQRTRSSQKNSKVASSVVGKEKQKSKKKKKQKDNLFSDSDTDPENPFPFPAEAPQPSVRAGQLKLSPGVEGEEEGEGQGGEEEGEVGGWGGGMLSDSSVDSVVMVESKGKMKVLPDMGLESEQKLSQVMAENERLKSEMETYKEKYRKEKQRNHSLTEQLSALKKKEAEETKALEDIVAKVEKNLVTTTKRAVSAETVVAKLKQEVQSLQAQLRQADAHSVHQHYEEILSGVRAKATYASKQLAMASMAANQSLRELMSGADTLKNVAEILQFIDRMSEVRQH